MPPAASATVPSLPATWRTSPWRTRPVRTFGGALVILALALLVGLGIGDWFWGAVTAVVLAMVTLDAFVPTLYVAGAQGLRIHGPLRSRQVAWADVKHVGAEADGAYLALRPGSPSAAGGRRGVTVLLDTPERGAWLKAQVNETPTP